MEAIKEVLKLKQRSESLPQLSAREEEKLQENADIDHVYHSSRIEGSRVTKEEVTKLVKTVSG